MIGLMGVAVLGGNVSRYANYAFAFDPSNGLYRSGSRDFRAVSAVPGYIYTRSGTKQELDVTGALVSFPANNPAVLPEIGFLSRRSVTNVLLNAGTATNLVTQTVTVTAQPYTLSFFGTGTVSLSGTSTAGPLVGTGGSGRVSVTFTPTAGTLTLTVTGTVQYAVLVAGTQAGPVVATAGSAASVGADNLRLSDAASDEDQLFIGAGVVAQAPVGSAVIATWSHSTAGNNVNLYHSSFAGNALGLFVQSGGTSLDIASSVIPAVGDRVAIVGFRRGGSFGAAFKKNNDAPVFSTLTAKAMPSIDRVYVGSNNGGDCWNGPVRFAGRRRGGFSDAEISTILQAL